MRQPSATLDSVPGIKGEFENAASDPQPLCVAQPEIIEVEPLRHWRARAEIQAIQSVLLKTGWNRKRAARLLKISYRGLLYKIRQHNIKP